MIKKSLTSLLITILFSMPVTHLYSANQPNAALLLKTMHDFRARQPSDINEHIPVLKTLAAECQSVVEFGLRSLTPTWGILHGLASNPQNPKSYLGVISEYNPPEYSVSLAKHLSSANDITFNITSDSAFKLEIEPVDMLFIDSIHTYRHLTYELEKFAPKIKKYIVIHDTSEPWGNQDDNLFPGPDFSAYPPRIDRNKRGSWAAVENFLKNHPDWKLQERLLNNHGLTILKHN